MADLGRDLSYALDPVSFALDRLAWRPDPWQATLLRSNKPTLVNCSRQSGKTSTVAVQATHQAVYVPGSLTLCVAPTQKQSAICARKINHFIKKLQPVERLDIDNRLSFVLGNGAEVVALPGEPDNLRGYSAPDLIILDEGAFLKPAMMEAILPMLAVSEGRLLILSTPNGRQGFFYETWMSGDPGWLRIRVPATDCPRIKPEYLEWMRRIMPNYQYRQEFYCEFTDTENALFSHDLIQGAICPDLKALSFSHDPHLAGAA